MKSDDHATHGATLPWTSLLAAGVDGEHLDVAAGGNRQKNPP